MEKHKVIISRKRWGTGAQGGNLLNEEGKMCCLGFICEQVFNAKPEDMLNHGYRFTGWFDREVGPDEAVLREEYNKYDTLAARINDHPDFTDTEREMRLLDLFADSPFELHFED